MQDWAPLPGQGCGSSEEAKIRASQSFFGGAIDELSLWNFEFSAAEVAAQWQNAMTGEEPGLVLYYDFKCGPVCACARARTQSVLLLNDDVSLRRGPRGCNIVCHNKSSALRLYDSDGF